MNTLTPAEMFEGCYIMRPQYIALWNLIDMYDKKHLQQNYPYQSVEVQHILRVCYGLLVHTKETAVNKEHLARLQNLCDKTNIENPDYLQINQLKDAIHQLYELGFPFKVEK